LLDGLQWCRSLASAWHFPFFSHPLCACRSDAPPKI
jgi:hypothetical protein